MKLVNKIAFIIAILLPLIFFGYLYYVKSKSSSLTPKYSFIYYIYDSQKSSLDCTKSLKIENNYLKVISTVDNNYTGLMKSFCASDVYYYYNIKTDISVELNEASFGNYEILSNNFYGDQKDPDGFEFNGYRYSSYLPFFTNDSKKSAILSKGFSEKVLKINQSNPQLISFTKN
jgi:hypothetical protein